MFFDGSILVNNDRWGTNLIGDVCASKKLCLTIFKCEYYELAVFLGMNFKQRLFFLLASILILAMLVIFFRSDADHTVPVKTDSQLAVHTQSIPDDIPLPFPSVQNCRMHMNNCFNIYQCGYHEVDKISIYVYPLANYFNDQGLQLSPRFSREFYDMVMAIKESNYYTTDMEKACLIVPPLDLLNQGRINVRHAAQILSSLPR